MVGLCLTYLYAADTDMSKDSTKDVKTLQGVVVDLDHYLMLRSEGKSADEASKMAGASMVDAGAVKKETHVEVKPQGVSVDHSKMMKMRALLVTEKGWLAKVTSGHDLYVICDANGSSDMSALELGKTVQVTGRVYDEDGVRAICVQKIEATPASAPGK